MTEARARSEGGRRLGHLCFGLFAFLLPFLDWRLGAGFALLALIANVEFLPRTTIGRGWIRPGEGLSGGIVVYPLTVLILVLLNRHALASAAMGFAVLAFGDPAAALCGRGSRRRYPFNPAKSPRGSLAFVVAATVAGFLLGVLTGESAPRALVLALPAALLGAAAEALPWPRSDNLAVGLAAAFAHRLAGYLA